MTVTTVGHAHIVLKFLVDTTAYEELRTKLLVLCMYVTKYGMCIIDGRIEGSTGDAIIFVQIVYLYM